MARIKKKEEKKDEQEVKTTKTIKEHAADGLVMILKELGKEDKKSYYIEKEKQKDGSFKEIHELTMIGSHEEMQVDGRAQVGFFDPSRNNQHFTGIKVSYQYTGKVAKNNWGQEVISVDVFNVKGLDEYQKQE